MKPACYHFHSWCMNFSSGIETAFCNITWKRYYNSTLFWVNELSKHVPLSNCFIDRLAIPVVRVRRQRRPVLLLHQQGKDDEGRKARLRQASGCHHRDRWWGSHSFTLCLVSFFSNHWEPSINSSYNCCFRMIRRSSLPSTARPFISRLRIPRNGRGGSGHSKIPCSGTIRLDVGRQGTVIPLLSPFLCLCNTAVEVAYSVQSSESFSASWICQMCRHKMLKSPAVLVIDIISHLFLF